MTAVDSVLVVGAGVAGSAIAILLAEAGVAVEMVEAERKDAVLGSGITLPGNALRVLRRLGVWEEIRTAGYAFDTVALRAPDWQGTIVTEMLDRRTGGSDLPASLGMLRPELARILRDRAAAVGATIRFGTACVGLTQDSDGVDATYSDGSVSRYDLIIAADGVRSKLRGLLGIDLHPQPTGVGVWRAFTRRPASVTRTEVIYGGPAYIAGYCPTGEDSLYCYLMEDVQDRSALTPEERLTTIRSLAAAYHGPWDEFRDLLTDAAAVNYTAVESHMLAPPWHRGRVVLIGDAVHACPPTLGQGAAQGLEDAAVLAELLAARDSLDGSLWSAFTARRYERVRTVVENSVQLVRCLLRDEQRDVPRLMNQVRDVVSTPA